MGRHVLVGLVLNFDSLAFSLRNAVDSGYSELPRNRQNWFNIDGVILMELVLKGPPNVVDYNRSPLYLIGNYKALSVLLTYV